MTDDYEYDVMQTSSEAYGMCPHCKGTLTADHKCPSISSVCAHTPVSQDDERKIDRAVMLQLQRDNEELKKQLTSQVTTDNSKVNAELLRENEELRAHVEALREALISADAQLDQEFGLPGEFYENPLLSKIPAQSLQSRDQAQQLIGAERMGDALCRKACRDGRLGAADIRSINPKDALRD